jgi:hypothetical protein
MCRYRSDVAVIGSVIVGADIASSGYGFRNNLRISGEEKGTLLIMLRLRRLAARAEGELDVHPVHVEGIGTDVCAEGSFESLVIAIIL